MEEFKGLVFDRIDGERGDDEIVFYVDGERRFRMYHSQDCCEGVQVEDVCGDMDDLIGSPIVEAEEVTYCNEPTPDGQVGSDSYTWTFYKLGTAKGHVTIRWLGESNGYYSESVDIQDYKGRN